MQPTTRSGAPESLRCWSRQGDPRHCGAKPKTVGYAPLSAGAGSMARITVEDCLKNVDNLFDLVMVAAKRARRLANGAEPMVDWENDKPTVVALREVAEGLVDRDILDDVEVPAEELLSADQAEEILASTPMPRMDSLDD